MRYCNENKEALKHFKKGYELDDNNLFKIEITRAYLYLHEFEKASKEIELLMSVRDRLDERGKVILTGLKLQYFKRKGEYLIDQREYNSGIISLGDMIKYYEGMLPIYKDKKNNKDVRGAFPHYKRAIKAVYGSQKIPDEVETTFQAFKLLEQEENYKQIEESQGKLNGIIVRMQKEKGFGFIKDDSGIEYFFHYSNLEQEIDYDELIANETTVKFESMVNAKGLNAINVSMYKTA